MASLTLGDLTIEGSSRAGDQTWFRIRPPGIGFDAGRGAAQLAGISRLFLTHGHLDHSLGIPYWLSLRTRDGLTPTVLHPPAAIADGLRQWIGAAETLEGVQYRYEIEPLRPGDRCEVGRGLSVEAFATDHSVPSLGFHLLRTRSRLKDEYRGRRSAELVQLKASGAQIEDQRQGIWLSYCGDTGPGVFDIEPRLLEAETLLIECTFFDDASYANASEYGHMHLRDLTERAPDLRNRDLVLHHMSRRYRCEELRDQIGRWRRTEGPRVHLFGC